MGLVTVLDPWATNQPTPPQPLTRDDLIEAAARALVGVPADHEWTADDLAPISSVDDEGVVGVWRSVARMALDAAYPQLTTAEDIDALPQGTVIVSDTGHVYRRALQGGLGSAGGMTVGTLQVWEQPGAWEYGRKVQRLTSQQVAAGGHVWTVAHRVAS